MTVGHPAARFNRRRSRAGPAQVVAVGVLEEVVEEVALHTVIVSVAGRLTWVPAAGLWLTTFPFCEGSQELVLATCTVSPWPESTPLASLEVWPTTFCTTTVQGPDEIVRLTELPRATDAPPGGLEPDTWPDG